MNNTCIHCGEIIPEGRQVCPTCENQIEEMAKDLQETADYEGCEAWHCGGCRYEEYGKNYFCSCIMQAEKMTAKDYRKQSEGEWENILHNPRGEMFNTYSHICKVEGCGYFYKDIRPYGHKFCPNCGAKMKGGV